MKHAAKIINAKAAAPVFLIAICLFFYGRYLGSQLPIGVDHTLWFAAAFSHQWDGGPPLWDPFTLGGVPAYDNLQMALFYPLRWPFYFVHDWRGIYGFFVFIHYPIAIFGMFFLARAWGMSRAAALAAAIVFVGGGHLAGRTLNPAIFYAEAWVPWLLLGGGGNRNWQLWLTTSSFALILAVGSPHVMLYALIAYAIVTFCAGMRDSESRRMQSLLRRTFHLAIGLALAAPALIPGVMRVARSVRAQGDVLRNLESSVSFREIWKLFLGGTGGGIYPEYIDKSVYIGSAALLLIVGSILIKKSWRDRRTIAAFVLIVAGLVISLGSNVGWQHLIAAVPGFKWMTAPDRALLLTALGAALACGLALDQVAALAPRQLLKIGATLLAAALAAIMFALWKSVLWNDSAFFRAPQAMGLNFVIADGLAGLLLVAVGTLVFHRRPHLMRMALVFVLALQCWHFLPRVLPPMRDRSFYDATPAVRFLQQQAAASSEPFRIAGYDALRIHNMAVDNLHVVEFLVPQLATIYGLQDVQGFDPLIPQSYADLIDHTSGRAPFNDPLRTLDLSWPDPGLLGILNVRYILGHPHDRRVSHFPFLLEPRNPEFRVDPPAQPSTSWTRAQSFTDWLFVSLVDGEVPNIGEEVARLIVHADEGTFEFPIRSGIETAWVRAANYPRLINNSAFRAVANTQWEVPTLEPALDYSMKMADWRGRVDFGRPLTVRFVEWRLTHPHCILNVKGQACRLAPPDPNPWRLVFGSLEDVAPVYEFLDASRRAWVADRTSAAMPWSNPPRELRWLDWSGQSMTLEAATSHPQTLFLLEKPDRGWRATVNGVSRPVKALGPAMIGVDLDGPPGWQTVQLRYRPRAFFALLIFAWSPLAVGIAALLVRRRQRVKKSVESDA